MISQNKNKNQKGQVTIFVIIGVILIVVVTFLLSNSKFEIFESKETKLINQVTDIVDACIKDNSERGVFLLGMQGGTIELDQRQLAVPRSYIDLGFKIPSWEIAPNQVPTITSMQNELNDFIQTNAQECIDSNLQTLNDIFDFDYDKDLQVSSTINRNNILIESNMPITFSEKNSPEKLSTESYHLRLENNNLGDLYSLALEIYSTEQNEDILSQLVLDQIYSAGDYSDSGSMPTEGFSFSCAKRVWTKTKLKQNLVNLNNNNFKYLYFVGTQSVNDLYSSTFNDVALPKSAQKYYDNYYNFNLENPKPSFANYKVEVSMPTSQSTKKGNYFQKDRFRTFEVTPSDGEVVQTTDMKVDVGVGNINIPCVQLIHNLYTLDYDVLVKLQDNSPDGDGTVFQFPLRVQINNNAPSSEVPFTLPSTSFDNQLTATNSKFCDEENRPFEQIVYAIDKSTQEPLNGANITYKCLSLSCNLGETAKPTFRGIERTYAQSSLNAKLPYCVGGKLSAQKEGFHSIPLRIDSSGANSNPNGYYDLEMIPTKSFELNENSIFALYSNGGGKRIEDENDGFFFISIKNDKYEFQSQAMWPTEGGIMDKLEFLRLDDAVYNASIVLTDKDFELVGIFELKNWKPDIYSGNNLKVTIPAASGPIKEDKFLEFYETSNKLVSGEIDLGFTYGVYFE